MALEVSPVAHACSEVWIAVVDSHHHLALSHMLSVASNAYIVRSLRLRWPYVWSGAACSGRAANQECECFRQRCYQGHRNRECCIRIHSPVGPSSSTHLSLSWAITAMSALMNNWSGANGETTTSNVAPLVSASFLFIWACNYLPGTDIPSLLKPVAFRLTSWKSSRNRWPMVLNRSLSVADELRLSAGGLGSSSSRPSVGVSQLGLPQDCQLGCACC